MDRVDRGNKLWIGHRIILPEHEELIREQERGVQISLDRHAFDWA
jgi:hypothetical protein